MTEIDVSANQRQYFRGLACGAYPEFTAKPFVVDRVPNRVTGMIIVMREVGKLTKITIGSVPKIATEMRSRRHVPPVYTDYIIIM
jgi:hypothetical protein